MAAPSALRCRPRRPRTRAPSSAADVFADCAGATRRADPPGSRRGSTRGRGVASLGSRTRAPARRTSRRAGGGRRGTAATSAHAASGAPRRGARRERRSATAAARAAPRRACNVDEGAAGRRRRAVPCDPARRRAVARDASSAAVRCPVRASARFAPPPSGVVGSQRRRRVRARAPAAAPSAIARSTRRPRPSTAARSPAHGAPPWWVRWVAATEARSTRRRGRPATGGESGWASVEGGAPAPSTCSATLRARRSAPVRLDRWTRRGDRAAARGERSPRPRHSRAPVPPAVHRGRLRARRAQRVEDRASTLAARRKRASARRPPRACAQRARLSPRVARAVVTAVGRGSRWSTLRARVRAARKRRRGARRGCGGAAVSTPSPRRSRVAVEGICARTGATAAEPATTPAPAAREAPPAAAASQPAVGRATSVRGAAPIRRRGRRFHERRSAAVRRARPSEREARTIGGCGDALARRRGSTDRDGTVPAAVSRARDCAAAHAHRAAERATAERAPRGRSHRSSISSLHGIGARRARAEAPARSRHADAARQKRGLRRARKPAASPGARRALKDLVRGAGGTSRGAIANLTAVGTRAGGATRRGRPRLLLLQPTRRSRRGRRRRRRRGASTEPPRRAAMRRGLGRRARVGATRFGSRAPPPSSAPSLSRGAGERRPAARRWRRRLVEAGLAAADRLPPAGRAPRARVSVQLARHWPRILVPLATRGPSSLRRFVGVASAARPRRRPRPHEPRWRESARRRRSRRARALAGWTHPWRRAGAATRRDRPRVARCRPAPPSFGTSPAAVAALGPGTVELVPLAPPRRRPRSFRPSSSHAAAASSPPLRPLRPRTAERRRDRSRRRPRAVRRRRRVRTRRAPAPGTRPRRHHGALPAARRARCVVGRSAPASALVAPDRRGPWISRDAHRDRAEQLGRGDERRARPRPRRARAVAELAWPDDAA